LSTWEFLEALDEEFRSESRFPPNRRLTLLQSSNTGTYRIPESHSFYGYGTSAHAPFSLEDSWSMYFNGLQDLWWIRARRLSAPLTACLRARLHNRVAAVKSREGCCKQSMCQAAGRNRIPRPRGRRQIVSDAEARVRLGTAGSERKLGSQLDVARGQSVTTDRAEGGRVESRIRSCKMRRVKQVEHVCLEL
jgi:hypothetical protein